MKMPVIGFCHGGNPNNMVIDLSDWMIVVSEMGRRLCLQRDDVGKVSIHSQASRPNSSPARTLPGAPFMRALLRMSGQSRSDPLSIDPPKCPNRGLTFTPRRQRRNNDQKERRDKTNRSKTTGLFYSYPFFIPFITVTLFCSNRIHSRKQKGPRRSGGLPHSKT